MANQLMKMTILIQSGWFHQSVTAEGDRILLLSDNKKKKTKKGYDQL